jgi:hypothetical protein
MAGLAEKQGSQTVAQVYTNSKGVVRVKLMFDADKLGSNGTFPKALTTELVAAIRKANSR